MNPNLELGSCLLSIYKMLGENAHLPSDELELELRFPHFSDWHSTLQRLSSTSSLTLTTTQDSVHTKGEYRRIGKTTQQKIKQKPLDFTIVTSATAKESVRFAIAHEHPVTTQEYMCISTPEKFIYSRNRTSFEPRTSPTFRIDMTAVTYGGGGGSGAVQYQVEIELLHVKIKTKTSKEGKLQLDGSTGKQCHSSILAGLSMLFPNTLTFFEVGEFEPYSKLEARRGKPPINVKLEHLKAGMGNCFVTNKLDGVAFSLFTIKLGPDKYANVLKNSTATYLVNKTAQSGFDHEIRCEVFGTSVYLFDVFAPCALFSEKLIVLHDRIRTLSLLPLVVKVKEFVNTGCLQSDLQTVESAMDKICNDGLIIQPNDTQSFSPLKWKYFAKISVDFKLVEQLPSVYSLQTRDSDGVMRNFINPTTKKQAAYKSAGSNLNGLICEMGGVVKDSKLVFQLIKIRKDKLVPNATFVAEDTCYDMVHELSLSTLVKAVAAPTFESRKTIIVDVENLAPHRPSHGSDTVIVLHAGSSDEAFRLARTTNATIIAHENNPILFDALLASLQKERKNLKGKIIAARGDPRTFVFHTSHSSSLDALRTLNNIMKSSLIERFVKGQRVLDLGSGKGGDLFKYSKHGAAFLQMVEPNSSHIQALRERLATNKPQLAQMATQVIQCTAQDLTLHSTFKVISAFFILTFFFSSEELLDCLVRVIDEHLEPGGVLIGATMLGQQLHKILQSCSHLHSSAYTVERVRLTNTAYGNEIVLDLKDTETATKQTEFLVDFNVFAQKLAQRSIVLKDLVYPPLAGLNKDEAFIESNVVGFVFCKQTLFSESNVPQAVPTLHPTDGNMWILPIYPYKLSFFEAVMYATSVTFALRFVPPPPLRHADVTTYINQVVNALSLESFIDHPVSQPPHHTNHLTFRSFVEASKPLTEASNAELSSLLATGFGNFIQQLRTSTVFDCKVVSFLSDVLSLYISVWSVSSGMWETFGDPSNHQHIYLACYTTYYKLIVKK